MKKSMLTFLLGLLGNLSLQAQVPDNAEGRLWRLCKVWGYLKYYSPRTCQVNWDSLLFANIPLAEHALTNHDFNEYIKTMLDEVGQIPPALASVPHAADTNLNVQLDWTSDPLFSSDVEGFLDTFKNRAGRNDSLACRLSLTDYETEPDYLSYIDFRKDMLDKSYDEDDRTYRLAALMHRWSTLSYFAVYRDLADRSWDEVLLELIPEAASGVPPFRDVLAKLQARLNDSHAVFPYGFPTGTAYTSVYLRRVENKIIVRRKAPGFQDVQIGDEVLKINGVLLADTIATYRDKISASNEVTFYRDALFRLFYGVGSASYEMKNAAGNVYTVTIPFNRSVQDVLSWIYEPQYPVWTTLCNGYGYVNMGLLMPEQVADMYADLKDKEAIVFDSRNYPNMTLTEIAHRLFPHDSNYSANYFVPDILAPGWYTIGDTKGHLGTWENPDAYRGKVFLLVNEETQSQAESTVQYLRLHSQARVVGSQTAGANGNVSILPLQGTTGDTYFSSIGYYYEDWYQCQRNGIKIDQVVAPTIAGIRAGRDEVLESVTGCVTAIPSIEKDPLSLQLYPNPVTDVLFLRFVQAGSDEVKITILDLMGKICYSQNKHTKRGNDRLDLNIGALPDGVYWLHLNTGSGGNQVMKFVRSR